MRHGQSQWNLENRFTGFTDVELTEVGIKEAKKAGRELKQYKFDAVFTSTLQRANHTARLALTEAGQEHMIGQMSISDALRERDYGALTGLNKDETREKYGDEQVRIWRRSYDVPPPEGESLKNVVDRVKPYYDTVIKPVVDANDTVLVAAHGNSLRALLIIVGEEAPETINARELATGVPIII